MRIACVIPTLNGGELFRELMKSLARQTANPDIIIIDSSSNDETIEIASQYTRKILVINQEEFNHGGTRQLAATTFPGYEFYVYLTQDIILENSESIKNIVVPFENTSIGAVCGRQVSHYWANPFASFARQFNYPSYSSVKSISNAKFLGIKTAFLSNSFAAYRSSALKMVGGFPTDVILGEDMYVAAKMLEKGWSIAYSANAVCRHSHNYSIKDEFTRYFDIGVFHARESWIIEMLGSSKSEGVRYVFSELKLSLIHI